ncbi:mitochondrial inner membrane protein required for protein import [Vanrija albida]|uniref:Mitochondrial import inner membrane translocase subunit TIM50 n=1 Tax=Vanrija albida TaxID=181172 RepID=A0ABR3PXX1_9TREE
MLRTSAARLLATAPRGARPLSRSAPAFIRIKKPEGAAPPPPPSAPEAPAAPADSAPAEPPLPAAGATTAGLADAQAAAYEAREAREEAEPVPETPDLSKLPSLDIDPEANPNASIAEPKAEAKGKGEGGAAGGDKKSRPRKEYVSSIERQRRFMSRLGLGALLVGGVGTAYYLGQQKGESEASGNPWENFKRNFSELSDVFSKPAFTQLLPDPLPPPHQRPYTLLVDLDGLLVHSSWDRQHGWRTAKRPGVDYFLAYLSQFYEIVLFTSQPVYTGLPVAEKLDPFTLYLPYKLFRESTRYIDGKVVKDLSYLNRDLSKTILLDINSDHAALQPENAIIVKPWGGTAGDKGLVELIPFLESIGIFAPADVRPVLKNYAGKDIPKEYAKQEAAMKERVVAEWERAHPNAAAGAGSGFLSGLFGGGGQQARPKEPQTYLEIKRAQAQRAYEEEQKYYKEHAEEFARMIEEDKQRQMAEMKGSIMGFFGGAPGDQAGQPPAEAHPAQK